MAFQQYHDVVLLNEGVDGLLTLRIVKDVFANAFQSNKIKTLLFTTETYQIIEIQKISS